MFHTGQEVSCPYGKGNVKEIRHHDNIVIVQPSTWLLANNKPPLYFLNSKDVKPINKIGDRITCSFGQGTILEIRSDGIYVVVLDNWLLATKKSPTLYLNQQSIKPFRANKQKSLHETIEDCLENSYKCKAEATSLFEKKKYEDAKNKYFEALKALSVRMIFTIVICTTLSHSV